MIQMPFPLLAHDRLLLHNQLLLTHNQLLQCFRTSLFCGSGHGDGCRIVNEHCTGRRCGDLRMRDNFLNPQDTYMALTIARR